MNKPTVVAIIVVVLLLSALPGLLSGKYIAVADSFQSDLRSSPKAVPVAPWASDVPKEINGRDFVAIMSNIQAVITE